MWRARVKEVTKKKWKIPPIPQNARSIDFLSTSPHEIPAKITNLPIFSTANRSSPRTTNFRTALRRSTILKIKFKKINDYRYSTNFNKFNLRILRLLLNIINSYSQRWSESTCRRLLVCMIFFYYFFFVNSIRRRTKADTVVTLPVSVGFIKVETAAKSHPGNVATRCSKRVVGADRTHCSSSCDPTRSRTRTRLSGDRYVNQGSSGLYQLPTKTTAKTGTTCYVGSVTRSPLRYRCTEPGPMWEYSRECFTWLEEDRGAYFPYRRLCAYTYSVIIWIHRPGESCLVL